MTTFAFFEQGHLVCIKPQRRSEMWDVHCSCGFDQPVGNYEAADDTAKWHLGRPSMLGDFSGIAWEPDTGTAHRLSWRRRWAWLRPWFQASVGIPR